MNGLADKLGSGVGDRREPMGYSMSAGIEHEDLAGLCAQLLSGRFDIGEGIDGETVEIDAVPYGVNLRGRDASLDEVFGEAFAHDDHGVRGVIGGQLQPLE
jgi:hypothetical protein